MEENNSSSDFGAFEKICLALAVVLGAVGGYWYGFVYKNTPFISYFVEFFVFLGIVVVVGSVLIIHVAWVLGKEYFSRNKED